MPTTEEILRAFRLLFLVEHVGRMKLLGMEDLVDRFLEIEGIPESARGSIVSASQHFVDVILEDIKESSKRASPYEIRPLVEVDEEQKPEKMYLDDIKKSLFRDMKKMMFDDLMEGPRNRIDYRQALAKFSGGPTKKLPRPMALLVITDVARDYNEWLEGRGLPDYMKG